MEKLREELHKLIEACNYNLTDARVIEKSQELDKELNKKEPSAKGPSVKNLKYILLQNDKKIKWREINE